MTQSEIIAIQTKVGTTPDGFWGPKSIAACQRYLRGLCPTPSPWPDTDQASLTAFYGPAGDESRLVVLPAPVLMEFEGVRIKSIRCHGKVAESLSRALTEAAATCPDVVRIYDGCYNNRPMRGGSLPSLHARGAAIDLWADANGNHVPWPTVAKMPFAVIEAFAREGWLSAGAFWGRDAMHFQATR